MSPANSDPSSRSCLAIAIAVASGWLAGSLAAAETPPPASPTTGSITSAPPQSIESAKKEFDALKAAREAAQRGQGSAALPRLTVPELQTGLGSDPRPTQGTKSNPALDPTKKSANWLIDGMTKEAARREGDRGSALNSTPRDRRDTAAHERGVDGALSDEASPNDPRSHSPSSRESRDTAHSDKEKSAEAPNPLNRYLAEWMTPRDYATLKPGFTEGLVADSSGRSGVLGDVSLHASLGGGLSGVTLPGGTAPPGTDALGSGQKSPAVSPPRENPYLQSFALPPAPAVNQPPPTSPPVPSAVVAPAVSPIPSPTPAKPAVPDFPRPAQDEKYFKQLKRF